MSFETGEWSLAKDKELIDKLEKRSEDLRAPLSEIPKKLDQLTTDTARLNLLLQNVIGDLNTLSEKRFIENRVAEAHDEELPPTPEPDKKPATDEELREAVRTGLKAFGLLPVEELGDDDDQETGYECFARDRPFSLIIGSKQWLEADPFEGVTPVDTVPVGGTPISEAMEDLVLPPSTSMMGNDVEEATEAEAWYQKERASVSTQGETRSPNSDSESPVISTAPKSSPQPPLLTELTGPNKPRGLFDEDSEDDGDLFGVSRKPSISPVAQRGSRSPLSQPASRRGSAASLRPEVVSPVESEDTPGPISFLDELKKRTDRRNPDNRSDVKSPGRSAGFQGGEKLPSLSKPPPTRQPVAQKRDSIFDSDSEGDIFATKPKPSPSFSESKPNPQGSRGSISSLKAEVRQSSAGSQQSVVINQSLKSPPDTDSEEEPSPRDSRKPSLPKLSPLSQVLPKLPKRNSLFDDSDSDSDIFGPQKTTEKTQKIAQRTPASQPVLEEEDEAAQVVKPKEFKGVRVLPQIPVRLNRKSIDQTSVIEGEVSATQRADTFSAPLGKRSQVPLNTPLESVVKPRSSESEDESAKDVIAKLPASRPKVLPTKVPDLFGDSDSEDDLFGNSPVVPKFTAAKKADEKSETIEQVPEVLKGSESRKSSSSKKPGETAIPKNLSERPEEKTALEIPSPVTFTDPLTSTKSGEESTPSVGTYPGKTGTRKEEPCDLGTPVDQPPKPQPNESLAQRKSKLFSINGESDEDFLPNPKSSSISLLPSLVGASESIKTPAAKQKVETDSENKLGGSEVPRTPDEASKPVVIESKSDSIEDKRDEIKPPGPSTSPTEERPSRTMTEKTNNVKKIGMGLPAGLLQGLKARQQQLGIAQPEPKRRDDDSESRTPEAQVATTPNPQSSIDTVAAMKSEHKDIVEIARNRVKGPTGRRLPSRAGVTKSSRTEGEKPAVSAQIETEVVEPPPSGPKNAKSDVPTAVDVPISKPEKTEIAVQPPKSQEEPTQPGTNTLKDGLPSAASETKQMLTSTSEGKLNALKPPPATSAPQKEDQKAETKPSRAKSKSIFASDSSDEDLFSPKAPPRKKSVSRENAVVSPVAKPSVPVVDDPLSAASSADTGKSEAEPVQPTAPKRASKSAPKTLNSEQAELQLPEAAAPVPTASKGLFSSSEDDDDGLLFGSKKPKALPKSATTSSLGTAARDKPKPTLPKSSSANLFGSDSDSDDLFKKK